MLRGTIVIQLVVTCNNKKNGKFLLQDVGRFGGKWHKPEGVKFELPYNKKLFWSQRLAVSSTINARQLKLYNGITVTVALNKHYAKQYMLFPYVFIFIDFVLYFFRCSYLLV